MLNFIKSLLLLTFIFQACNHQDMKINVLNTIEGQNIPSGSGIVKAGDTYYIIGDDSPFLFALNQDFKIISKTPLITTNNILDKRIIKSEKPDFETLEMIDKDELVVFGSGSKSPQRDKFLRIFLKDSVTIESYELTEFYNHLKKLPLFNGAELNIEATAYCNNQIFLFNRKKNLLIRCEYQELLAYLKGETAFPKLEIKQYILPKINGIEAGFSGATVLKNELKILFTASVENTNNAYDDGEILGSFIGIIEISNHTIADTFDYCQIPDSDKGLKVESVAVLEEISTGKTNIVLITDDDKGNSKIIKSELLW